jgi:ketosteroid isomerase-like protein
MLDADRMALALDKLEIREALVRWCRGLDLGDAELLASVYHEDAVDEHGTEHYTGATAGHGYVAKHLRKFRRHLHTVFNETIAVDGDVAHCESYSLAYLVLDGSGPDEELLMTVAGRYLDRFERRDGVWKIAFRRFLIDWRTTAPIMPRGADGPFEGRRSRDDPSYELLTLLDGATHGD